MAEIVDDFMERAFHMAHEALDGDEVPVGCVFVYRGVVVGAGRNEVNASKDPSTHAEMVAIRRMEEKYPNIKEMLPEMSLYVTLEPCIMCGCGLYELGIKRIVYGAANDRFGGIDSVGGRSKYKSEADIEIVSGVQADRAVAMLKAFYDKQNPFAPEEKRKVKKNKDETEKDR